MGKWTTLPLCLVLGACGGKAEAPAAPAPTSAPSSAAQPVGPAPAPVAAEPEKVDPFADQPRVPDLSTEWWLARGSCPDAGVLVGAAPPKGRAVYCKREGKRHGLEIRWGRKLVQVSSYRSGEYDGPYAVWSADGKKIEEGLWRAGKQEGTFMQWYPGGAPKTLGHFAEDKRTGEWTYWGEDGSVQRRAHYRGGVIVEASEE